MTKVVFVQPDGQRNAIDVLPGLTLMEAAVQNNVAGIDGDCGGSCNCGTCHVWVDEACVSRLAAPEATESGMVECLENARPNSRLCCQIRVSEQLDGLVLRLPSDLG